MKYLTLQTLFGWFNKPMLLWGGMDKFMFIAEIVWLILFVNTLLEIKKTTYYITFISEKRNARLHLQYAW